MLKHGLVGKPPVGISTTGTVASRWKEKTRPSGQDTKQEDRRSCLLHVALILLIVTT